MYKHLAAIFIYFNDFPLIMKIHYWFYNNDKINIIIDRIAFIINRLIESCMAIYGVKHQSLFWKLNTGTIVKIFIIRITNLRLSRIMILYVYNLI